MKIRGEYSRRFRSSSTLFSLFLRIFQYFSQKVRCGDDVIVQRKFIENSRKSKLTLSQFLR